MVTGSGITISSSSNNPKRNKNDKTIPLEINDAPKTIFIELFFLSDFFSKKFKPYIIGEISNGLKRIKLQRWNA